MGKLLIIIFSLFVSQNITCMKVSQTSEHAQVSLFAEILTAQNMPKKINSYLLNVPKNFISFFLDHIIYSDQDSEYVNEPIIMAFSNHLIHCSREDARDIFRPPCIV